MMKDVVCGMNVEEDSKLSSEHDGKKYHFCSKDCKAKFDKNPEEYAKGGKGDKKCC
ncbi:YHS domain-containing protein [Candidatus Marsarchaeota archaeon]|nr:YHS domain-containing protein [Candidatus Marsarchaeota archaeon]MCL5092693.1 YHS domain-containing protein [Candidatus Marsarchaeota archaeon]